jgi:hypothetical protein
MANNNIEKEVRFFYPASELDLLHKKIVDLVGDFRGRYYELTIMYDNPNPELSFYPQEIDGRLRFRTSIHSPQDKETTDTSNNSSKITWKRRLPKEEGSSVHKEEEIEADVNYEQYENMQLIFEKVLHCKRMSSYERYRSQYSMEGLEITLDEFPYGVMLEVELNGGSEDDLLDVVKNLGLSIENSYHLSCDDKYVELCENSGQKVKDDILFNDSEMPKIS